MLAGLEHLSDPKETEVAVLVRDATPLDARDDRGRDVQTPGEILERHLQRDVVTEPGERDSH
jgi:hypothetical protein